MKQQHSDRDVLKLVKIIDNNGTNLTKSEITFIAGIIDSGQTEFSIAEMLRAVRIHQKRVVNGRPEED